MCVCNYIFLHVYTKLPRKSVTIHFDSVKEKKKKLFLNVQGFKNLVFSASRMG